MYPVIVVAYNASAEAADGLALGRLLADLQGADLLVAPVLANTPSSDVTDRHAQRGFWAEVTATHIKAQKLLGDDDFELWPVFGEPVPTGIQALAADQGAGLIVFGSPQHGPIGPVLLGYLAEEAVHGAPCAVAIAPHGFHAHPRMEPRVVGVAFDGSPQSMDALRGGHALARVARASLRVITVETSAWHRPMHRNGSVAEELARRCAELGTDVNVEPRLLHGDPAASLARESHELGLLVCGSREMGPMRHVMLGSVTAAVMRSAACPLIVVPRGLPEGTPPAAAAPSTAVTRRPVPRPLHAHASRGVS